MTQLSDYSIQVQNLLHDLNLVDFSQSEITGYINEARLQVAMDFHCIRQLFTNFNTIAQQETYAYTGSVGGIVVSNGGSSYSTTPVITIAAPTGPGITVQATASAVVVSGVITTINMTNWGQGYIVSPAVTITDGSGSGAVAAANATINVFDVHLITSVFGTQRWTADWLPFTPFQAFARSYVTQFGMPGLITTVQEANLLYMFPIPDQIYGIQMDAVMLPTNLVNLTDFDTQIPPWLNTAVQFYAAWKGLIKLQQFTQAEWMKGQYDKMVANRGATRQTRRIRSAYANWVRRIQRR